MNASNTKTIIVSRSRTIHPQSPLLTIGITVLKESDDVATLGVTFDSKMTFDSRSVFALFPEQLLKDFLSWGSPGECSMIDRFLGDAFGVLSYPF